MKQKISFSKKWMVFLASAFLYSFFSEVSAPPIKILVTNDAHAYTTMEEKEGRIRYAKLKGYVHF